MCLLWGHRRAISINVPAIIEGCFQDFRSGLAELICVTEWFSAHYHQKLEVQTWVLLLERGHLEQKRVT